MEQSEQLAQEVPYEGRCFNWRIYREKYGALVVDVKPDPSIIMNRGMNKLTPIEIANMIRDLTKIMLEMTEFRGVEG